MSTGGPAMLCRHVWICRTCETSIEDWPEEIRKLADRPAGTVSVPREFVQAALDFINGEGDSMDNRMTITAIGLKALSAAPLPKGQNSQEGGATVSPESANPGLREGPPSPAPVRPAPSAPVSAVEKVEALEKNPLDSNDLSAWWSLAWRLAKRLDGSIAAEGEAIQMYREQKERATRAEAERDEYKRDAERYRWLRAEKSEPSKFQWGVLLQTYKDGWWSTTYGDALDERIDTAMNANLDSRTGKEHG